MNITTRTTPPVEPTTEYVITLSEEEGSMLATFLHAFRWSSLSEEAATFVAQLALGLPNDDRHLLGPDPQVFSFVGRSEW